MISDTIKYIGVDDLDIDLFESQYRSIEKYFAENRKEEYLRNISRLKTELGWEAFATKLEDFINTL